MQTRPLQRTNADSEQEESLNDLAANELKDICRVSGVSVSGQKQVLVDRFKVAMESLGSMDDDDDNESLEENEGSWSFMQDSHVLMCSFDFVRILYDLFREKR